MATHGPSLGERSREREKGCGRGLGLAKAQRDKGCVWRVRQSKCAVRDQRGNGVASGGGDGHDDRGVDSVSHALEGGGGRGRMELFHEEG